MDVKFFVGVCPVKREATMTWVQRDADGMDMFKEAIAAGVIMVPCTKETARSLLGERVDDIYAIVNGAK